MNGVEGSNAVFAPDLAGAGKAQVVDRNNQHSFPVGTERGDRERKIALVEADLAESDVGLGER